MGKRAIYKWMLYAIDGCNDEVVGVFFFIYI